MPESTRGREVAAPDADAETSGAVVVDMAAILTYPVCNSGHRVGRVRSMLRVTAAGRAEVESTDGTDEDSLRAELDRTYAGGEVESVGWWVPVGDWATRRTAWRLGFSYGGVLRGWLPTGDAWAFTRRSDDPAEPRTRWLENPV